MRVDPAAAPAPALPSPWIPGTHFSGYEIESRLAVGGMAEIWRAKLKGLEGFEKRVVIKTMLPELHQRPEMTEMFAREASLAARLSHPNIVDVLDFGQMEGRYFIAMEYVPGLTLRVAHRRTLASGGRLPIAATLHILRDVCAALQHLHDLEDADGRVELLHRDVSPDNVILSTSGASKLIDFGAARAVARTPPGRLFVGKYRYAAPERIRHQDEDCRSDIYSAGVMLYECLVGRRPFEGSDAEVIKASLSSPACDPCARAPGIPPAVGAVVRKATAQNPGDRFASARELGVALAGCLRALGASTRERDVTAALSELLDATPGPVLVLPPALEPEAVPEAIGDVSSSNREIALSERELLEASGPLPISRPADDTVPMSFPVPAEAFASASHRNVTSSAIHPNLSEAIRDAAVHRGTSVIGWRTTPASSQDERAPAEPGVALFDLGIQLRAEGRYREALESWEQALALAPDNRLYQSQVQRLREHLSLLRRAPARDRSRPSSR
ncbi:MAG TPA: protein kinase [Polyangia bacterium]|nr:protein kinase [Polyangia bacterium]